MDLPPTYHIFFDYPSNTFSSPGIIVPQAVYTAPVHALIHPRPSITFVENGELGVRLRNALDQDFEALDDSASTPLLSDVSSRITCGILWPGYEAWSEGIHIVDGYRSPISRARLAFTIARSIERFMFDVAHVTSAELRSDWWTANVRYDDLFLVELRHVSVGSWQPVLRLALEMPP